MTSSPMLDTVAFYGAGWQIIAEKLATSPDVSWATSKHGGANSSHPIRSWPPRSARHDQQE